MKKWGLRFGIKSAPYRCNSQAAQAVFKQIRPFFQLPLGLARSDGFPRRDCSVGLIMMHSIMTTRSFTAAAGLLALWSATTAAEAPSKVLVPPDNLVAEGIPAIPADLVEQVGRYTESRGASFQDWNPARTEILITTRFGDTNQVHRVAMPGGARTQLTFFNEPVTNAQFEPKID